MKKIFTLLSILVSAFSFAQSGIRITEISYNGPEAGSDSTEFIEIYNPTSAAINMTGFTFTSGIVHTFGNVTIPAAGFVIVAVDSVAMQNVYGVTAYQWAGGGLSNGGEPVAIKDAAGVLQDSLRYDDNSPWPTTPDGNGPSLVLCDLNASQTDGANWAPSNSSLGIIVNSKAVFGSPGAIDSACSATPPPPVVVPTYPIATINTTDANGVADSNGVNCWIKGVVLGVNMSGSSVSFTMYDNGGIGVFGSASLGYTVNEGDSIALRGTVGQYNGLTQMSPDSISLLNTGNVIPTPVVVTSLGESTESSLVKFENALVTVVSGSNYTLVSGTDTITMRVDSDTDVLDSLSIVMGDSLCSVTGIAGQFDSSSPYLSGYQLYPRTYMDVDTTCGGIITPPPTPVAPTYPINVVNTTDANGVADSNGVICWIKGVVLGVNMSGSSVSFTMYDNGGIGVYGSASLGYSVNEGDSIALRGTVGQYNGLTQMSPDSISLLNTGNVIPTPVVVTSLGESTESSLVKFENALVTVVSGSNYTLVSGTDTITMRVDSDTDVLDSLSIVMGDSLCSVTGIVGQFDSSNPYLSGYQLFPRTYMDVDTTCGGVTPPPPTPTINTYDIATIRTVDANGELDSLEVYCKINGIVHGVDLDGNDGFTFALIDATHGITVHSFNDVSNYVVTEGDELRAIGTVKTYNGLAQFRVDSIVVISTGNCIPFATVVDTLGEMTESNYIEIKNVILADTSQWPTPGNNANIDIVTPNGDTLTMRIDKDTYIADSILVAPLGMFNVIGTGGQFDGSSPYFDGYQIFPQFPSDIDVTDYSAPAGVQINEIAYTNTSAYADGNGDFYQWVELFNGNSSTINMSGYFLSTDSNNVFTERLPRCFNNTSLDMDLMSGAYGAAFLGTDGTAGPAHMMTMLDTLMPFVGLYTANGTLVNGLTYTSAIAVDGYTYGAKNDDYAQGTVTFTQGTPEATNVGGPILSVISTNAVNPLNVYPNPVTAGNINFNKVVSFNVYSITGQVIKTVSNVNRLNVSDLDNGVYIIKTTENEIVRVIVK